MNYKFLKYLFYTFLISIGTGILIQLNVLERVLDPLPAEKQPDIRWHMVFMRLTLDTLVSWFSFIITYFVVKPLEPKRPLNTRRIILAVIITIFSVYLFSELIFGFRGLIRHGRIDFDLTSAYFFKDLVVAAIILTSVFIIKMLFDRQQMALENEQLNRENLESQYESLRTQISPHFLFNSLSALRSLINTDRQKGVDYLDHLSDVLRKTLQNQEQKTVSVADELTLVNSYNFLLKMRYEDNLEINIEVPDKYRHFKLPQLALQTLVENAVKHNVISKRHHMHIDIFVRDEHIVVRNTLKSKDVDEAGTGFGLSNLSRQYELLGNEPISIRKTGTHFEVSIPMIR